jgi:GABA(A) receptor-associated protein
MDLSHEIKALQKKYTAHVFVHVKRSPRASNMPELDKHKFIVQREMSLGTFMFVVRKRMKLPPEKAMFLFVDDTIPTTSSTMGEISAIHGENGVLVMHYAGENTFGCS